MLDYALVAALGMDATAAVRGYRLRVIAEAERRGLRLTSVPVPDVMQCSMQIRLAFLRSDGYADLAGRELRWSPADGWSVSHSGAHIPARYYAGPDAVPLDLVPISGVGDRRHQRSRRRALRATHGRRAR